jgi:hypothetical protein
MYGIKVDAFMWREPQAQREYNGFADEIGSGGLAYAAPAIWCG